MAQNYFNTLNYTLANEDTALELGLLDEGVGHVFSVAGSGGRVLPLLAKAPKKVTCVDLVQEQLYLTELRIESTRALSHSEFLSFWGYPPRSASPVERENLFDKISLSGAARTYLFGLFESLKWESVLYEGKWEKTFKKLSKVNNLITGTRGLEIFKALSVEEQKEVFERSFPKKAWKAVLMILGNAGVFNALLYKGSFPKKNIEESFFELYRNAFDRLFTTGLARENFFLQLVFFGKVIFPEGCPIECDADVFAKAKKALSSTVVIYQKGDLIKEAAQAKDPIDFISLSDVPSYFSGSLEKNFMKMIQPALAPGARVILRNYLHIPENLDLTDYEEITGDHQALISKEKLQVYDIALFKNTKGLVH